MKLKAFSGKFRQKQTVMIFTASDFQLLHDSPLDRKKLNAALKLAKEEGYTGKLGSFKTVNPAGNYPSSHLMFVGLGARGEGDSRVFRETMGQSLRILSFPISSLVICLPPDGSYGEDTARLAQLVTEGARLATHHYDVHLTKEQQEENKKNCPREIQVWGNDTKAVKAGISLGEIMAEATIYARDLVSEGASIVHPEYLATCAQDIASQSPQIKATVWDEKKLLKQGFGGIYAVGRASDHQPRFIRLEYKPKGKKKLPKIALLGKGVTFDTGGVNIKPTAGIAQMKQDMAGAAAVLGAFSALGKLQPNVHVVGLVPAAENMVGPYSYKPGDILTTYGGKTIEVINTDAEGRILLADAIEYCMKHENADTVIDMATLTGAVVLALGVQLGGLFCNDRALREELGAAGDKAGEQVWELPLHQGYAKDLRSEFAGIKNAPSTRYGGPIHGALFLKHFMKDGIPWAHFDIAAVAYSNESRGILSPGGTGFTVRTLLEYLNSK